MEPVRFRERAVAMNPNKMKIMCAYQLDCIYTNVVYNPPNMKRTNIYLTERQMKELDRLASKMGISVAELIRRILDERLFPPRAESNKRT